MIHSVQNSKIRQVVKLRDRKQRQKKKLFLADGYHEIAMADQASIAIQMVFICEGQTETLQQQGWFNESLVWYEVSETVFSKICYGQYVQQGVVAVMQTPDVTQIIAPLDASPLLVVGDRIEKPGNIGAMLRTLDATGVSAFVLSDLATDLYNPNIIRASRGAVFSRPVVINHHQACLDQLRRLDVQIVSADPDAECLYTDCDFTKPTAFVVGREDQGLSAFWQTAADVVVKIPMVGRVNSLNVSVSMAVLVYEALRQRQKKS